MFFIIVYMDIKDKEMLRTRESVPEDNVMSESLLTINYEALHNHSFIGKCEILF